jgi:hypothetical protein
MTTMTSFTTDEWNALIDAPQLVALAVALSGASGIAGTIKETFASSKAIVEGMQSDSELIRSICSREEVKAAESGLREVLPQIKADNFAASQQKLATLALDRVRTAIAVLQAKAPTDLAAYRSFVTSLGERVAEAAKEGAFLGFGGERVSAPEKALLAKLAEALNSGA